MLWFTHSQQTNGNITYFLKFRFNKECPMEELLEVFKREDNEQVEIGKLPASEWVEFARYLDLPPHMLQKFSDQITHGNAKRYKEIKFIMGYWSRHNAENANLGSMLSIIEPNFKWDIVTGMLL